LASSRGCPPATPSPDIIIAVKRLENDNPIHARFEINFEKARGVTGADSKPFKAHLALQIPANHVGGCSISETVVEIAKPSPNSD
jgi:hypothetical protein